MCPLGVWKEQNKYSLTGLAPEKVEKVDCQQRSMDMMTGITLQSRLPR